MGLIESIVGQEGPLMADPCLEEQMTLNNKKINDVGKNNRLELQDQAKLHDNRMKELMASHMEDQQRSVQVETNTGKWDPPEMGLTSKSARWYQAIIVQPPLPRLSMG